MSKYTKSNVHYSKLLSDGTYLIVTLAMGSVKIERTGIDHKEAIDENSNARDFNRAYNVAKKYLENAMKGRHTTLSYENVPFRS